MKRTHWLLFIFSAFLYAAPTLWSTHTWPLVFIFAVPFLYVAAFNYFTFLQALIWGVVAFGCHLGGVVSGMDNLATGSFLARLAPTVVLVGIAASYAVIWILLTQVLKKYMRIHSVEQTLALWTVSYWIFIMFMEYYSFAPYGRIEGHSFFNPLFVLAHYPRLLTLLIYIGKSILTLLIMSLSGTIAYALIKRSDTSYVLVMLLLAPWIIGLAIPLPALQEPLWLKQIKYIPAKISSHANLTHQASIARNIFQMAVSDYPEVKLIILPESSIFCDHLSTAPELCALWSEQELGKPIHIVLGSFRWDGPCYRNSFMWFYDGKLQEVFDKRHAMLLTEELPQICRMTLFKKLFFSTYPGIVPAQNKRPQLEILEGVSFIPYICSELFFNDRPDDTYPTGSTVLAITNDLWCIQNNVSDLMQLAARFRAIQWQRNVVYISFAHGNYFDKYGNQMTLH